MVWPNGLLGSQAPTTVYDNPTRREALCFPLFVFLGLQLMSDRRDFLKTLAALPLATLAACHLLEDSEVRAGKLADLRRGPLALDFNGKAILVLWQQGRPVCYSLICTHKECTVDWQPDEQQFLCPCHKGRFDAQGRVLSGKPKEPLRRLRTELRGDEVWVLNETANSD